jgi:hypothetical protein
MNREDHESSRIHLTQYSLQVSGLQFLSIWAGHVNAQSDSSHPSGSFKLEHNKFHSRADAGLSSLLGCKIQPFTQTVVLHFDGKIKLLRTNPFKSQ